MSKRIAALMSITMLLLAVTGYASSYKASQTKNITEAQSSTVETNAGVTTAAIGY